MIQVPLFTVLLATSLGDPTVAWHYDTGDIIMCSPAVGDLDPSSPGSEIVIGHMFGGFFCLGSDSSLKWVFDADSWCLHPAIADIDDDGDPEVLLHTRTLGQPGHVYCLNSDGTERWSFNTGNVHYSGLTIANVDTMGHPEILAGGRNALYCLNHDGSLRWSYPVGYEVYSPAVANIDEQGTPEVIFGSTDGKVRCLDSDGNLEWERSVDARLAWASVADVDLDGEAEILVASGIDESDNVLHCLESDGALRWSKQLLTGGANWLSMAAIDNINNDSLPEIVVFSNSSSGSRDSLYVLQDDGSDARVVWAVRASDGIGGSGPVPVIFDIDGDGIKEVVWEGTEYLRIHSGLDGAIEYENADFRSYTAAEHPAIADIDGDGHAEIVAIYRDTEVGVLESDDWVECRDQFSCYTYHITNINDDLSVPTIAPNHWETHNSWLAQGLPTLLGSISGGKFYDSNVNGVWDGGEPGMADWLILLENGGRSVHEADIRATLQMSDGADSDGPVFDSSSPIREAVGRLSVDSAYTDSSGHYSFSDLEPGAYAVREVIPVPPPTWIPTTPTEYSADLQPGQNLTGIDFGNVALGEIGARTIGYWKNHPDAISDSMYAVLTTLSAFVGVDTFEEVLEILTPPWPDMQAKLRAQLLAMTLNVLSGMVPAEAFVYLGEDVLAAELLFGEPPPVFKSAQEVPDAVEAAYDWSGWSRSEQEAVKDLLDRMNNDLLFVLPDPPDGVGSYSNELGGISSSDQHEVVADGSHLLQNLPNPFSSFTVIAYQLRTPGQVSIKVYDLSGRLVRTLVDGERRPGLHCVEWDGRADSGRPVANGIYLYRMEMGDWAVTEKMTIVR